MARAHSAQQESVQYDEPSRVEKGRGPAGPRPGGPPGRGSGPPGPARLLPAGFGRLPACLAPAPPTSCTGGVSLPRVAGPRDTEPLDLRRENHGGETGRTSVGRNAHFRHHDARVACIKYKMACLNPLTAVAVYSRHVGTSPLFGGIHHLEMKSPTWVKPPNQIVRVLDNSNERSSWQRI